MTVKDKIKSLKARRAGRQKFMGKKFEAFSAVAAGLLFWAVMIDMYLGAL